MFLTNILKIVDQTEAEKSGIRKKIHFKQKGMFKIF